MLHQMYEFPPRTLFSAFKTATFISNYTLFVTTGPQILGSYLLTVEH